MGSPGSSSGLAGGGGGGGGAGAGGDGGAGAGGGGGEGDFVCVGAPSILIASSAAPKSGQAVIATARSERTVFPKCMTKIENQGKVSYS